MANGDLPISIAGVLQPASDVPAWTTVDINLGYSVPEGVRYFLGGVQLNVNVRNLFDRNPPTVLSTADGTHDAMDPRNANPFGRTFQFTVSKKFQLKTINSKMHMTYWNA